VIYESQISEASFDVRLKAKATRAFERGNCVLVAPHDESKVLRLVEFIGNRVLCVAFETGEACGANDHGKCCYHAVAAKRRREINAKRRRTIAARKLKAA